MSWWALCISRLLWLYIYRQNVQNSNVDIRTLDTEASFCSHVSTYKRYQCYEVDTWSTHHVDKNYSKSQFGQLTQWSLWRPVAPFMVLLLLSPPCWRGIVVTVRAGGCQTCGTHISVTTCRILSVWSSVELFRAVVVHCYAHLLHVGLTMGQ